MKKLVCFEKISVILFYLFITSSSCNNVSLALLETVEPSLITSTGAISGGNITSDGGGIIKYRGVCWGTMTDPTINNDKTYDGSGTGIFSSSITDLKPATTYYVRAYATNKAGTSYGNLKSFATLDGNGGNKNQIIADHQSVLDFSKIPPIYLAQAKKMMVAFLGESHSMAFLTGMELLENSNSEYACNVSGGEPFTDKYLRIIAGESTGEAKWFTWFAHPVASRPPEGDYVKKIIKDYSSSGMPISVLGFVWCIDHVDGTPSATTDDVHHVRWYGLSLGGPDGNKCWGLDAADYSITGNRVCMDTYLNATNEYIEFCKTNNYCYKVVYTTCPPHGYYFDESGYQGHLKLEYIRNYVKADPSRILFDYADILCYDDDGTTATNS
jgi:hypothetical protein